MKKQLLLILLVIVFVLDLCIIGFKLGGSLRFLTKPFLIPILILYYRYSTHKPNRLFQRGLFMSFLGDFLLMFFWGFIPGLCSFLIAHILYILTFKPFFQQKNILFYSPPILIFIIGLCAFLYPHLGIMKFPVFAYAITIGIMLYIALGTNVRWIIIGALLFVLSDAILSINLFYKKSLIGSFCVMLTYVIAQFCLVQGMLKQEIKVDRTK